MGLEDTLQRLLEADRQAREAQLAFASGRFEEYWHGFADDMKNAAEAAERRIHDAYERAARAAEQVPEGGNSGSDGDGGSGAGSGSESDSGGGSPQDA